MRAVRFVGSLVALVLVWGAIAATLHSTTLPSPVAVFLFIVHESVNGDMLLNIGMTLWRVIASFVIAMAVGTAIGLGLGRARALDQAFMPWVLVLLNTPALVITALCYIWLGLGEFAAIVAVALNKIPNVAVLLRDGARSFDPALDDMSRIYRFSAGKRIRHIFLPQLAPFLIGAARSGLSLVWKIVLVVELLGRPNGVGYAISYYFQLFDVRPFSATASPFRSSCWRSSFFCFSRWTIMRDAGDPPLLEIDIARKSFGDGSQTLAVIAGLRFGLARGSVTCLLGPSGCGKTTALRIVLGLDSDFVGRVSPPVTTLRVGVVFQDPRLLPWRTVEENIRLAAPDLLDHERDALFAELDLTAWRNHRPGALSVGMARRAAIARALSVDPQLLVLDEAFVSLDERGADILRTYVFEVARARGTTVLSVTHNIREALRYSDSILVLAPRPTSVAARIDLDAPVSARDDAWIDDRRIRLLQSNPELQA